MYLQFSFKHFWHKTDQDIPRLEGPGNEEAASVAGDCEDEEEFPFTNHAGVGGSGCTKLSNNKWKCNNPMCINNMK